MRRNFRIDIMVVILSDFFRKHMVEFNGLSPVENWEIGMEEIEANGTEEMIDMMNDIYERNLLDTIFKVVE